jgi:hypothetical protein
MRRPQKGLTLTAACALNYRACFNGGGEDYFVCAAASGTPKSSAQLKGLEEAEGEGGLLIMQHDSYQQSVYRLFAPNGEKRDD